MATPRRPKCSVGPCSRQVAKASRRRGAGLVDHTGWACLLLTTLAVGSCTTDTEEPGPPWPDCVSIHSFQFASVASTGDPLWLDLYRPCEADAPLPVVVFLHGGAWFEGARNDPIVRQLGTTLASHGFAMASADYRLVIIEDDAAVGHHFPDALHDVVAAVRWLRANAGEQDLDPGHIGVMGLSAGAHLGQLLALTHGIPELEGEVGDHLDQDSSVQAVVSLFAPSNLLTLPCECHQDEHCRVGHLDHDSPEPMLLGCSLTDWEEEVGAPPGPRPGAAAPGAEPLEEPWACDTDPGRRHILRFCLLARDYYTGHSRIERTDCEERALWASPATYASETADFEGAFLLIHGTEDTAIPKDQTVRMGIALDHVGIEREVIIAPGWGHDGGLALYLLAHEATWEDDHGGDSGSGPIADARNSETGDEEGGAIVRFLDEHLRDVIAE